MSVRYPRSFREIEFKAQLARLPSIFELTTTGTKLEYLMKPAAFRFLNIRVDILEVVKVEAPWGTSYIVTVSLTDGKVRTRPFPIFCEDTQDFVRKLREEVFKFVAISRIFKHEARLILRG